MQKPCPDAARETLELDTRSLDDGAHRVQVAIEDAGGNETTALDRTVDVRNTKSAAAPTPTGVVSPSSPGEDRRGEPQPAAHVPTPVAGTVHLGARLSLAIAGGRGTHRRFSTPVRIGGRLVSREGRPLPGEKVTLVAREARPGAPENVVVVATAGRDGRFAATVPGGPSRTIVARYGEATARTSVVVRASVTFRAGGARVGAPTWLTGRLQHLPRAGVLVQIQALDGRKWRTFDTTKTRADGTFRYAYRFKAPARGRRFALRVLVDSPVYPFAPGPSAHHWVVVR